MAPLNPSPIHQLDPATQRSEGDINRSDRRADWQAAALDDQTRRLLEEDSRYFLHQSLSTPCLTDERRRKNFSAANHR